MNYAVKVKAFIQIFPVKIVRQDLKKKREREREKKDMVSNQRIDKSFKCSIRHSSVMHLILRSVTIL